MAASHTHTIRVRYSECDMQGHVFNAHWLSYFDLACTELWRAHVGDWAEVNARGVDLVVAQATVAYRAPARFDDEIALTATIERLGNTSIVTALSGRRHGGDGALFAEGELVHVVVDTDGYAKQPVPDWLRSAMDP